MSKYLKKPYFWIVFSIILLGIFLRAYHFKELLFFEVDQARDWRIVEIAEQYGAGELPLLGPGMNDSRFRIGPIYHYIQYSTALIFGNTPGDLAYPDMILSILAIPLFYLLLREYFSRPLSSGLTLLFASSLFAVEYGRFAMNSNSLPFFVLLIFYALLRLSRENEPPKKWFWVMCIALSLGIVIQLHALMLVTMPIFIPLYLVITKTRISQKQWLAGILLIVYLASPIIINETMTGFESVKALFGGASHRKSVTGDFGLIEREIRNTQEFTRNYTLILFSKEIVTSLNGDFLGQGLAAYVKSNLHGQFYRTNACLSMLLLLFFAIPFWWLLKKYFSKNEETEAKRNFILLLIIWQILFFLLFAEIVNVQHTRYYLPLIFLPFILLGLYLEKLTEIKKYGQMIVLTLVALFFIFNLIQVKGWLQLLENYSAETGKTNADQEFVQDFFYVVTWRQVEAIDNYLEKAYADNQKDIYLMSEDQFYSRSIRYPLIYEKNIPLQVFSNSIRDKDKMYFFIKVTSSYQEDNFTLPNTVTTAPYRDDFEVTGGKVFGTLTVLSVKVKDIVPNKPASPIKVTDSSGKNPKIKVGDAENKNLVRKFTWNQFFQYLSKSHGKSK